MALLASALTLAIWEYLLNLEHEIVFIWRLFTIRDVRQYTTAHYGTDRAPLNFVSGCYVYARYAGLIAQGYSSSEHTLLT